jgi:putative nucleotidyltransferase with HDIG domain
MAASTETQQNNGDIPDKILEKVKVFPSMPQAGIKLRALLAQEDVSTDEIEQILRLDPGLAANVLRLANSAFFGVPAKVRTLKHAVMLLGIQRFSQIAVTACMNKAMDRAVEGYGLSAGELWLHSITVSSIVEALAKYRNFAGNNDFFTPALLHDLGKLILGEFVKKEQSKIEDLVSNGVPYVIAEKEVLGTNHAEVGALVLSKWRFPDDLIDAVRWHHLPQEADNSILSQDIVYLANLMSHANDDRPSAEAELGMPYSSVLDRLGITSGQFTAFSEKACNWATKLSDTLTFE